MKRKEFIFDPPEGWRYGFPRTIPSEILHADNETLKNWLKAYGYPERLMNLAMEHSRHWEEDIA